MLSCIFCQIVENKCSAYRVFEDAHTLAFLDTHPSSAGHTLVIPKKHGKTILDYTPDELAPLWKTLQTMARKLERVFRTSSLTIGINHGEISGIPHLHVHLIPRFPLDGGGIVQSVVSHPSESSLQTIREKILRDDV